MAKVHERSSDKVVWESWLQQLVRRLIARNLPKSRVRNYVAANCLAKTGSFSQLESSRKVLREDSHGETTKETHSDPHRDVYNATVPATTTGTVIAHKTTFKSGTTTTITAPGTANTLHFPTVTSGLNIKLEDQVESSPANPGAHRPDQPTAAEEPFGLTPTNRSCGLAPC